MYSNDKAGFTGLIFFIWLTLASSSFFGQQATYLP
jgi:hypothetical protein